MSSVDDKKLQKITGWPLGVNNVAPETEMPNGSLRSGVNIDLSDAGKPRRRKGRTQVYAGVTSSLYNSIGMTLFSEGGTLKRLWPDYSATDLSIPVHPNTYVSYATVNNEIVYMDGDNSGRIDANGTRHPLGLDSPNPVPTATVLTYGGLPAGGYLWSVTYTDATGQESGSSPAQRVEVEEGGGIQLTDLPDMEPDAAFVNFYQSLPDGDTMYHAGEVPVGTASHILSQTLLGKPLETEHMDKLPPGHIVRYHKGRVLSAVGNTLFYSEPLRFGLTKIHHNYYTFAERITNVIPVVDGVYVVAEATYFIAGTDHMNVQQVQVSQATGVEGTDAVLDPSIFGAEGIQDNVGYWFASDGATLGVGGGAISKIMDGRVEVDTFTTGATLLREEDGISQMVTALRGNQGGGSLSVSDVAVAEVRRNGIII